MKMIKYRKDGTKELIQCERNLTTIKLRMIPESDWTQVVTNPAQFTNELLWK
jgi:hypothetical protein